MHKPLDSTLTKMSTNANSTGPILSFGGAGHFDGQLHSRHVNRNRRHETGSALSRLVFDDHQFKPIFNYATGAVFS
jgi:hypothetical protein